MANLPKLSGTKKRQAIDKASRIMLLWVVAASVTVSFLLVGAQFFYRQFTYNAKVLSAKNEAASTLEQNLESIEELKKAFGPLNAGTNKNVNSSKVLSALPPTLDPSAFGTSLQQVFAPRAGVTIDSLAVESGGQVSSGDSFETDTAEVEADPTPKEISASLIVSGNYEQIQKFVDSLEHSIRPILVNSLDLAGSDSNVRATIDLTTYYQPTKTVTIIKEELPR